MPKDNREASNEMRYIIMKQGGHIIIEVSGKTRNNEPLIARKILSRYLGERGIRVILNLNGIEEGEPTALAGVLNSIRKEIGLLRGDMKLCSLPPALLIYFKENRLDKIFTICEDEQTAKRSTWRNYGGE